MNYSKLVFLIFFFLTSQALANVKVIEWNEEAKLTDYGRISKFYIKIQAVGLPENSAITSFSINSSSDRNIVVSNVKFNALSAKSISEPRTLEIFLISLYLTINMLTSNMKQKIHMKKLINIFVKNPFTFLNLLVVHRQIFH